MRLQINAGQTHIKSTDEWERGTELQGLVYTYCNKTVGHRYSCKGIKQYDFAQIFLFTEAKCKSWKDSLCLLEGNLRLGMDHRSNLH